MLVTSCWDYSVGNYGNTEANQQAKEQQHTWWSSRRCELNKPARTNIYSTLFDIYALFLKEEKNSWYQLYAPVAAAVAEAEAEAVEAEAEAEAMRSSSGSNGSSRTRDLGRVSVAVRASRRSTP